MVEYKIVILKVMGSNPIIHLMDHLKNKIDIHIFFEKKKMSVVYWVPLKNEKNPIPFLVQKNLIKNNLIELPQGVNIKLNISLMPVNTKLSIPIFIFLPIISINDMYILPKFEMNLKFLDKKSD